MRWLKVLLAGCVVLAASLEDQEKERQWLTWAEIMGGDPPSQREHQSDNAISDQNIKDFQYNNEEYAPDYDYYDVDERFFDNPDYIYVDTEDENYIPPEVEEETSEVPQTADRRTLDFFYHLFHDQFRNGDNDARGDPKPRRPSLIEAVFQTIDNHIVEDLREWNTYTAQQDAQVANTESARPTSNIGVPASIQPVSSDNNLVFITDEQGHQHVVTINDIVSSLGHLDERALTDLFLSPPSSINDRSSEIQLNPSQHYVTAETQNVPVVLGTQKIGQVGALRPVRHTGPTSTPTEEEEVYVVQDENGEVQFVTLDNIISSLALLDDENLNSLLFQDTAIPSIVPPTSLNSVSQSTSKASVAPALSKPPVAKPVAIPSAVLPDNKTSSEVEAPKKQTPSVSTDFDGNLRVLAHPGSVTVDLKDLSWQTNNGEPEESIEPEEETEEATPLFIGGSLVKTDSNGDIYITPDPEKPFTLDIHNIIALAEQAENPARPNKVQPSKIPNELKEVEQESEDPNRGHELLSYLAGVENFLPAAILPGPLRPTVPNTRAAPQISQDPSGVSAFRSSLLQALNQQRVAPQPTTPQQAVQPLIQRLVQPVVQPIVQPIVQAVTQSSSQSSSEGIGATLSRLLSNFVGQSTPQQIETVPQTKEKTPEQEFIKLVVRQQAPNSLDTHFGDVTIPLPQPIHFQHTRRPAQVAADTTTSQISPRVDVSSPLSRLSPIIQRSLQLQANNVPRFIPPGARAIAASRSDSGQVIRTDNKVEQSRQFRPNFRSITRPKPTVRPVAKLKPIIVTPPPVTKKPALSLTSLLSGLPPKVLESLRKQVQNTRVGNEDVSELPETEQEAEAPPAKQLDRSSYATVPEYPPGDGGYGYGYDEGYNKKENPLLDIYFLADLTKVHKIGDSNLSVKSPIIGDPAYFVKTRHHEYYR